MTMELDRLETAAAAQDYESIVQQLVGGPGNFPEAALRLCQRHSAEVTPFLIRSIEEATEQQRAGETPPQNVHLFAMYLLWEFQAKEALPAIVAAISLPEDGPFDLFGDTITEDLAQILATLAGDQPAEFLDGLIANRELNHAVRWEAAQAYVLLVRDGKLSREVVVERLRKHLRSAIDSNDSETPAFLISEICHFHPHEALAEIREAFDRELVDEFIIDRDFTEKLIAGGEVESQDELARLEPTHLADTVEHLRGWYWFTPLSNRHNWPLPIYRSNQVDNNDEPYIDFGSGRSTTIRNESPRIGRNDPCPCGSGKKYKKCCLRSEPLL